MSKTELIDQLHHEHAHLTRLFDELSQTFRRVAAGSVGDEDCDDALATAAEDLGAALDEMLHHFSQEEEILFVEISERFPELSQEIERLERNHESIAGHARSLLALLGRGHQSFREDYERAIQTLSSVSQEVTQHTLDEAQVYGDALKRLAPDERRAMLEQLKQI
jgi:hemerythrin-like domain-containing protein